MKPSEGNGQRLEKLGHKPDCPCGVCRAKIGELKGKNHTGRFKGNIKKV